MSLWARQPQQRAMSTVDGPLIPARQPSGSTGPGSVTEETALRNSAVWACLRLRADLVSTFPLDVYRMVAGVQVEMPKPPILVTPGGEHWPYDMWMYASQVDLDRCGNTIGLITEKNGAGLPAKIELQSIRDCSVIQRKNDPVHRYKIGGKEYTPDQVWHERQFPVAGSPVGLSPVAYSAWTLSEHRTMQDFVLDWYNGAAVPRARLRNTMRKVDPKEARIIKQRHKASLRTGDLFVHGNDWEYAFMQAEAVDVAWIEGRKATIPDIARFYGCPVDLIEAAVGGSSITYATITQRNLQLLIMNLGPAVIRRENRLTNLLPRPRFVKLNTDALLRMDPLERAKVMTEKINNRTLTVTEARALDNRMPLTPTDIEEFNTLFGVPRSTPTTASAGSVK